LILKTLRENKWNRRKAARDLKISYRTLLYQMRELGIASNRMQKYISKRADDSDTPSSSD
jgi:DNA-binding NtrC family response regulator